MIFPKTGSVPSLAMGVTCGALMMYGAYQIAQDPRDVKLSLGMLLLIYSLTIHVL